MKTEIIADCGSKETRIALLEDSELAEIYIEKNEPQSIVGNIYRGKVSRVLPGMQAAFVDIGMEKNAFLYVADAIARKFFCETDEDAEKEVTANISDILSQGNEITVQVVKDASGNKGARVTMNITLPGRHLVLAPKNDYVGVSRRIEKEEEKEKLRAAAEAIRPDGFGLIVRTASIGKTEDDFARDLEFLMKLWSSIEKKEESGSVPRCLHKDVGLIYRSVRDLFTEDIDRFVINDYEQYENVLELMAAADSSQKRKVELYSKDYPIFEYYNIESAIARAMDRKVWLKCGAYLIIDPTEALTVIDVNTGKFTGSGNLETTVLKTNLEAAAEIARQVRLRNIGGIIIIDFIDMKEIANRQEVLDTLKAELKKDRTKTMVVGMTGLGLIEMTRKKMRLGLSSVLSEVCDKCGGSGRVKNKKEEA